MPVMCYLMDVTVITLEHFLFLIHLCPCLDLCLFMSHLCDLYFILSLSFIVINHIVSLKHTHLSLVHFLEYLQLFLEENVDKESK